MGHHLFIWRINQPSEGGRLVVADNRFGDAPCGAAVYAIIAPEAAEQIEYRDNIYEGEFLIPDKRSL